MNRWNYSRNIRDWFIRCSKLEGRKGPGVTGKKGKKEKEREMERKIILLTVQAQEAIGSLFRASFYNSFSYPVLMLCIFFQIKMEMVRSYFSTNLAFYYLL